MPDEPEWAKLRNDLIRNTLADRRFNPVDDPRLVEMQNMYNETRKKVLDAKKRSSVVYGYPFPAMSDAALNDLSSGSGLDFILDEDICPVCGQDRNVVRYCNPGRHPDHAKKMSFDSDTVVDGTVVDENRELE